jgi:hypothetical protein
MLRSLPAALAALLIAATPACASQGVLYRRPGPARGATDRAYAIGYDAGRERGEQDARGGRSVNYQRHREYRNADSGYRGYSDRHSYREVFRQGFADGYNEGYRRYARVGYGRGGRFASPAAEHGYRDGFSQGRSDARRGRRYDPVGALRYRSADHGYNRRYGSRDTYSREYRVAFQGGYDRGYQGSQY